jgi:hypothetical protein
MACIFAIAKIMGLLGIRWSASFTAFSLGNNFQFTGYYPENQVELTCKNHNSCAI